MFHPSMIVDQIIRIKDRMVSQDERNAINEACGAILQLPYAMSQAEKDVLDKRRAQVTREGFFPEHDDKHVLGELGLAAALYALPYGYELGGKPIMEQADHINLDMLLELGCSFDLKPEADERRRKVKAAALILAEIERLDRAEARANAEATHA